MKDICPAMIWDGVMQHAGNGTTITSPTATVVDLLPVSLTRPSNFFERLQGFVVDLNFDQLPRLAAHLFYGCARSS